MIYTLNASGSSDDTCLKPQVLDSLYQGKARFGWSYKYHQDLILIKDKLATHHWDYSVLDAEENHAWKNAKFLLDIKCNDYLVYINYPSYGECIVVKATGTYSFDRSGLKCGDFDYADDSIDFRHFIPINKEEIYVFNRNADFVSPALKTRLKPRKAWQRIYLQEEFENLVNMLKNKNIVKNDASIEENLDDLDDSFSEEISDPTYTREVLIEASPTPQASPYSSDYYSFLKSHHDIEMLLETTNLRELSNVFYGMLYANIITTIETYLYNSFIKKVKECEELRIKFIEKNDDFKKMKINFSDIFVEIDKVEKTIEIYLQKIMWHNIKKVEHMYNSTFNVLFPEEKELIHNSVITRHDLIHRNGYTHNGIAINITKDNIQELLDTSKRFVLNIERQFNS